MENSYAGGTMYYDAERGILVDITSRRNINPYGKGTTAVGDLENDQDGYDPSSRYTDGIILVTFSEDQATLEWIEGTSLSIDRRMNETQRVVVGGR